jgi:hypothetical protein
LDFFQSSHWEEYKTWLNGDASNAVTADAPLRTEDLEAMKTKVADYDDGLLLWALLVKPNSGFGTVCLKNQIANSGVHCSEGVPDANT